MPWYLLGHIFYFHRKNVIIHYKFIHMDVEMDSNLLSHILELMPILAVIGGMIRWIFQLKDEVKNAHARLDGMEDRQNRFEDKNDHNMVEINRRIDDCKDSILKSINAIYNAINKT